MILTQSGSKIKISQILYLLVFLLVYTSCKTQPVKDKLLARIIAEQTDVLVQDLNSNVLAKLSELEIKDVELQSLEGLRACVNLKKLVLQNCHLSDISELKYLSSLEHLNIALNPEIRKIEGVSALKNLKIFIASGIQIDDISPLAPCEQLERLYLNNTKRIINLKPLENLSQLSVLEFYDNQVADLQPISQLTKLERLWMNQNQVTDITPLKNLKNLRYLMMSKNQIQDISPIGSLKKLTVLDFSHNEISNISIISDLINQGAFTDTTFQVWWLDNVTYSPVIVTKGNLKEAMDDEINTPTLNLIKQSKIPLIHD